MPGISGKVLVFEVYLILESEFNQIKANSIFDKTSFQENIIRESKCAHKLDDFYQFSAFKLKRVVLRLATLKHESLLDKPCCRLLI